MRERQVRGPLEPTGPPVMVVVKLRRYLCRACNQVVQVGPRGLLARRYYAAQAVFLALCLFGALKQPAHTVREALCPLFVVGEAAVGSWATLRRWIQAIRNKRLFASVRRCPNEFTLRQVAERAVMAQVARALPDETEMPIPWVAFLAGGHMA